MEEDLSLANEVWVGLGDDVEVVGWKKGEDGVLRVVVCLRERPVCGGCGGGVWAHGRGDVQLADMPVFEAPVRLVWRKRRWRCPSSVCEVATFTDQAGWIAPERSRLTSRAGRWATEQVGRWGRTVAEAAKELRCAWDTIDRAVDRWGEALLAADTERVGAVDALGLDETLFQRRGRWHTRM